MEDDAFSYDIDDFDAPSAPGPTELGGAEATYGARFAEALAGAAGALGPEVRAELDRAAAEAGLSPERVAHIEQAVRASHAVEPPPSTGDAGVEVDATLEPLAPSDEPRIAALQRRIARLEQETAELRAENEELRAENEELAAEAGEPAVELEGELAPAAAAVLRRSRALRDPAAIHQRLRQAPRDAALMHTLYRALGRVEDLDRRFCVASALVYLGEAHDEERATYVAHVQPGVVRPKRAVNEDEWRELLMHPLQDPLTGEILADIAAAALLGQMAALRKGAPRARLDLANRADPNRTTVDAVRSLAWAATVLGLRVPPIYVMPTVDDCIEVVLDQTPTTRVGRKLLAGRSVRELAFAAGRHLSAYRRELILAALIPALPQLEDVFLAALLLGNSGLPIAPELKARVEPLARVLAPLVDAQVRARLGDAFNRFVEKGARTNLAEWRVTADHTATCAGMLLAADLDAAAAVLALEDEVALAAGGPARLEERMDDLLVFVTAHRYSLLRRRIGVAVTAPA
ncbi:MAG: hypothetical protein HY908_06560 [Myxococcales bacterium]|nr:hypothetical protein [Myxococcales bacterium]